jgi:hypothetical protein
MLSPRTPFQPGVETRRNHHLGTVNLPMMLLVMLPTEPVARAGASENLDCQGRQDSGGVIHAHAMAKLKIGPRTAAVKVINGASCHVDSSILRQLKQFEEA